MNPTTKIYLDFIETLANTAKRSPDVVFRERIRVDMLRYISRILNMTSIYLCQYSFEQKHSFVKTAFVLNTYDPIEAETDIGDVYPEAEDSAWSIWFNSEQQIPHILYAEDLTEDQPEYEEYGGFDALSVIFAKVNQAGNSWGYIECWDTRNRRDYPLEERALLKQVCELIGTTLLTEVG